MERFAKLIRCRAADANGCTLALVCYHSNGRRAWIVVYDAEARPCIGRDVVIGPGTPAQVWPLTAAEA